METFPETNALGSTDAAIRSRAVPPEHNGGTPLTQLVSRRVNPLAGQPAGIPAKEVTNFRDREEMIAGRAVSIRVDRQQRLGRPAEARREPPKVGRNAMQRVPRLAELHAAPAVRLQCHAQ